MTCNNPKCTKYNTVLKSIEIGNVRFADGGIIFAVKPYCTHCGKDLQ